MKPVAPDETQPPRISVEKLTTMKQNYITRRAFALSTSIGLILAFALGWSARVVTLDQTEAPLPMRLPATGPTAKGVQGKSQTAGLQEPGTATVPHIAATETAMSFDQMKVKLGTLNTANEREQLLRQFIETTGKLDPQSAIALMRELPAGDVRDSAALALLGLWTGLSSSQMADDLGKLGAEGALILHLMAKGQASPEQAGALAKEFLRGSQRTEVLARAAMSLAETDPNAAFALGSDLVGNQQMAFLQQFAKGWGRSKDPTAALQWANEIPDEQTRAQLRAAILASSAGRDPAAVARFALTLPPNDSERTTTLEKAAGEWSRSDTEAAQRWAQQLPDPTDRAAAEQGIQQHANVGVGIILGDGPNGFSVDGLFQGGAAQLSGAVKPGDIILGVSDEAGGWVDARTVPVEEMGDLIRGAPQSYVSLRLQSPTDATPRTVTLARRQLIMRPDQ